MPNWVTSIVKVENPKVLSEKLLRKPTEDEIKADEDLYGYSSDDLIVDFEKFIPCPQDLKMEYKSPYLDEESFYNFQKADIFKQQKTITPLLDSFYDENLTQQEFVDKTINKILPKHLDLFRDMYKIHETDTVEQVKKTVSMVLKGYYNKQKHGHVDSYDFHIEEWGTKWNATTHYANEDTGVFEIRTAWSCPLGILKELSMYTKVTVAWASEDTGSNIGLVELEHGTEKIILQDEGWQYIPYRERLRNFVFALLVQGYELSEFENYEDNDIKTMFNMTREELEKNATELYYTCIALLKLVEEPQQELPNKITVTETDINGNAIQSVELDLTANKETSIDDYTKTNFGKN